MQLPKFTLLDVHDDRSAFVVLHTEEPRFVFDPEERALEWWSPPPDEEEDVFDSPLLLEAQDFYERSLKRIDDELKA
jgi:hypothetical protein